MKAKQFIFWLGGFLQDKETLTGKDIDTIKSKMSQVDVSELPELRDPYQQIMNDNHCKFPSECGLPQVWHGIIPPTCNKCGYTPPRMNITCSIH